MEKKILSLLMSFLFLTTAQAQNRESNNGSPFCVDQAHFYAKFFSGANLLQNTLTDGNKSSFKAGYIVDASLGYCWSCGLRFEAEYAFRRNGIKRIDFYTEGCSSTGHFQTYSCMANLLWGLPESCWKRRNIKPLVGLGIGWDFQQMQSSNSRIIFCQKWNNLSWQAMVGIMYPISCNTDMTLEYKFHQSSRTFYNHSGGIGLMYKFGFSNEAKR